MAPRFSEIGLGEIGIGPLEIVMAYLFSIAAPVLAQSAGQLAEISGPGKTFVGTALVA